MNFLRIIVYRNDPLVFGQIGLGNQGIPRSGFQHIGQNKIHCQFPDMNSHFPDDIWAENFIYCAKKVHQDQMSKLLHDWDVKFHDILTKFYFSLTDHKIPWQFPDFEKFLISLTCMNPADQTAHQSLYRLPFLLHLLEAFYAESMLFKF